MMRILTGMVLFFASLDCYGQSQPVRKMPVEMESRIKTMSMNDSLDISVSVQSMDVLNSSRFLRVLNIIDKKVAIIRIRPADLSKLQLNPNVIFMNEVHTAREELSTGAYDLTLNGISYAHTRFVSINGDSLNASIKERLFDTLDIDLDGRVFKTGLESSSQTPHASLMATIVAGGANTSPNAKGGAWKARLTSSDFANLFPDPLPVFQTRNISVQNHSYGSVVENFYGNEAMAYDQQTNQDRKLLHVFSSGNSGNTAPSGGLYSGIAGFANLTGNFKQAKNIITVGSVDSSGQVMTLSSRGPSYDGRIKPELVAYGEDGSSGAAALVSGASLLVQHAYKKMNGIVPDASTVKAVLLNSASDAGAGGPDFSTGYGNLDAYKAVATIVENRFFESVVTDGDTKDFTLLVPAGVSKLKATLVWNDPASVPNNFKSLVNDLDMQLELVPTGEVWLPWVLDHSPNAAALQMPVLRKQDTLNTVEQITVDNPVAGSYMLQVHGSNISTSSQSFSIAWLFDTAGTFYWTYPSGDPLIAGNRHWLRWECNLDGAADIEYATSGDNWRSAGHVADIRQDYLLWQVPDTTSTVVLRMVTATGSIFLSDTFVISPQLKLDVGFDCPDSLLFYWNSLQHDYRLLGLTGGFLASVLQTSDTSVILDKLQYPSLYYTIEPLVGQRKGIRSNTLFYPSSGVGCYIKTFYLQSQTQQSASFTAGLGTLFGVSQVALEKLTPSGFIPVQVITNPATISFLMTATILQQGENHFRFRVTLSNGRIIYSNVEIVYHLPENPVILYPNPVAQNNILKVINNESGRYTLQFFDLTGKLVHQRVLNSSVEEINTGFFEKGMYLVKIIDRDGKARSQKLVIW